MEFKRFLNIQLLILIGPILLILSEFFPWFSDENLIESYQEWPIFKEFRKSDIFLKTYNKIYKKEFVYLDYEDDTIQDIKLLKAKKKARK